MLTELEKACGLKIDSLVNNTNLIEFSNEDDLINSNKILSEVASEKNIKLAFCSGMDDVFPGEWGNYTPDGVPFMRMKRNIFYYK